MQSAAINTIVHLFFTLFLILDFETSYENSSTEVLVPTWKVEKISTNVEEYSTHVTYKHVV
ncbi:hypothetical protein EMIT0210MI2_13388 [Priestia megaterium]